MAGAPVTKIIVNTASPRTLTKQNSVLVIKPPALVPPTLGAQTSSSSEGEANTSRATVYGGNDLSESAPLSVRRHLNIIV